MFVLQVGRYVLFYMHNVIHKPNCFAASDFMPCISAAASLSHFTEEFVARLLIVKSKQILKLQAYSAILTIQ